MAADALGTPAPAATPTVGVVSDEDHRLAMAGMIAPQTSTLAVRTGVMWGPGTTALVTGTSATGTMTYAIAVHHAVTTRGTADGIYLGPTLDAATTVATTPAPGANSRIDIIWAKQNDTASTISADTGSTAPLYGVANGTAAVSPVAPSIPVGAIELARATVAVGATSTNGAGVTITNTARQTVARGADIPVQSQAERDALSPFWPLLTVKRLDTGNIEMRNAANNAWVTIYDAGLDSGWTTFNPTWATSGTAQPSIGNGTLVGKYRKLPGRVVETDIYLSFGSTTDSGNGDFRFTLPFPAVAGREHLMLTKAYLAGALWPLMGNALVTASGGSTLIPYVATSPTDGRTFPARNQASGGSAAGTSVPTVPAAYAWVNGSNLTIAGRYESTS